MPQNHDPFDSRFSRYVSPAPDRLRTCHSPDLQGFESPRTSGRGAFPCTTAPYYSDSWSAPAYTHPGRASSDNVSDYHPGWAAMRTDQSGCARSDSLQGSRPGWGSVQNTNSSWISSDDEQLDSHTPSVIRDSVHTGWATSQHLPGHYDTWSTSAVSSKTFENLYRYRPPPIERRADEYTISVALIENVGPDVLETVSPDWGLLITPSSGLGPSTLYTVEASEHYENNRHLGVYDIELTHSEQILRSHTRVVSHVYKLADVDNKVVPRHTLHSFITAFSPNRSGSYSPVDTDPNEWTSAHWVFRTLFFIGTTGRTYADNPAELRSHEQQLCSRSVELPVIINVIRGQYVVGRAIGSLKELWARILHHWMFDGKLQPIRAGPIPVHTLP